MTWESRMKLLRRETNGCRGKVGIRMDTVKKATREQGHRRARRGCSRSARYAPYRLIPWGKTLNWLWAKTMLDKNIRWCKEWIKRSCRDVISINQRSAFDLMATLQSQVWNFKIIKWGTWAGPWWSRASNLWSQEAKTRSRIALLIGARSST